MTSAALVGAPIGANTDAVVAGGLNASGVSVTGLGAPAQLGTKVLSTNGAQYILVQAGSSSSAMAAISDPNAYAIDENFRAKLMTTARAAAGLGLGFAPAAVITANDYFWARVSGTGFTARVAASASAQKWLRTTIVKGRLGTASTASACVFPVVLTAVASASTSANNTVRTVYMATQATLGQQAIANALAAI